MVGGEDAGPHAQTNINKLTDTFQGLYTDMLLLLSVLG